MEKIKLSIGGTLKAAFALYRKNFNALLKFALVSVLCTIPLTVGVHIMGTATEGISENLLGSDFGDLYGDFNLEDYDFDFEAYTLPEGYTEDIALKKDLDTYDFGDFDAYDGLEGYEGLLGSNEAALGKSIGLIALAVLLVLFSLVLTLILGTKAQLGAQFYLADAAGSEDEKPTIKGAYAKTKGKVAPLVGYSLLLGLIAGACIMPLSFVAGLAIGFTGMNPTLILWILIPVILPAVFCVQPWTFLLTPVVAFDEQTGAKLSRTSQVIKGNFLRIACVALVATFAGSGLVALSNILTKTLITFAFGESAPSWLSPVASAIISALITMVTFGFAAAAAVVTYQTLRPAQQAPAFPFGYPQAGEPVPPEYSELPNFEPQAPAPQAEPMEEPAASEEPIKEEEDIPEV